MNKKSLALTILLPSAILLGISAVTRQAFPQQQKSASAHSERATAPIRGQFVEPFTQANVPQQAQLADLIVVGHIKQISSPLYLQIIHGLKDPSNPAIQRPLEELKQGLFESVTVDRVLKGALPNSSNQLSVRDLGWENMIKVDKQHGIELLPRPADMPSARGCPQLTYGILFLKADKEGRFTFVDEDHIAFPASPEKPPGNTPQDPLAAVAGEVFHVLETPVNILNRRGGALGPIGGGDGVVLASTGDVLCEQAVDVIIELPRELTQPRLKAMATDSPDLRSQLWAIDCLIKMGDVSWLNRAKTALLNPPPELGDACRQIVDSLERQVYHQAKQSLNSTNLASVLTDLLHSTSEQTRLTALTGLQIIGATNIAKPLADVALNDDEARVRTQAMNLLCTLTGVSESIWRDDPSKALTFAEHADRKAPFPQAMSPGAQFQQREIDALLNKQLPAERGEWYKVPRWCGRGKGLLPGGLMRDAQDKVAIPTSDGLWLHTASWAHHDPNTEGWTSQGSNNQVFYGDQRCFEPVVKGDTLTQECTAFYFCVDLKGGYEAVSSATMAAAQQLSSQKQTDMDDTMRNQFWALPSATITDAWQVVDEETLEKLPNDHLKITSIRRIFGFDGKPRTEAISGFPAQATSQTIKVEAFDTSLPPDSNGGTDWRASLEAFLKNNPDELHKLR